MFKTQHGRIPMDPTIVDAIGHRFMGGGGGGGGRRKKTKNADEQVWADMFNI